MSTINLSTVELVSTLRAAPMNGSPSSADYNDSWTESLADLAALSGFINDILIPMLDGLDGTILPNPNGTPNGLEGRYIFGDTSDTTPLFFDDLSDQSISIADSLRLLNGIIQTSEVSINNLQVAVTTLQTQLSSTNQNDISQALQNFAIALQNLTIQTIANTQSIINNIVSFQTNGVINSTQNVLNLVQGSNVTLTPGIGGMVTISATGSGGGGGTPGGTNGQIQYNNSGTFGGLSVVPISEGGTGANLSTTGGASQVLRQSTVGGNVTVGSLVYTDINGVIGGNASAFEVAVGLSADTIQGFPSFTFDNSTQVLGLTGTLTIAGSSSGTVSIGVAAIAGTSSTLILPTTTGTSGQILSTNGGSPQQLSWETPPSAPTLKTDGTTNSTQTLLNLSAGSNITITESSGTVTIAGTGGGGGTTPGGSTGQIQYNNSGAFGGIATSGTGSVLLGTTPTITNYLTIAGTSSGSASIGVAAAAGTPNEILLPLTSGTSGQVLSTNGANPQQTSWISSVQLTSNLANYNVAIGTGTSAIAPATYFAGSSALTFTGQAFASTVLSTNTTSTTSTNTLSASIQVGSASSGSIGARSLASNLTVTASGNGNYTAASVVTGSSFGVTLVTGGTTTATFGSLNRTIGTSSSILASGGALTVTSFADYYSGSVTITGATVTNLYGFYSSVQSGATFNAGFYSANQGSNYAFYAAGGGWYVGNSGVLTFAGSTSGSASISAAAIAGTPNKILLPTTTGTAGQALVTNGANPQQTSWASVLDGTISWTAPGFGQPTTGEIAFATATNTLGGSASLTYSYNGSNNTLQLGSGSGNNIINFGATYFNIIGNPGNGQLLLSTNLASTLGEILLNPGTAVHNCLIASNNAGALSVQLFDYAPTYGGSWIFTPNILTIQGATSGSAQIGVAAVAGTPSALILPTSTGTAGQVLSTSGGSPQQLSWINGGGGGGGGGISTYGSTFTSQTSVTILGTAHGLGTADLTVSVYDSATGTRNFIFPNSISIDSTTYNVTVTFVNAQSGRIVLEGSVTSVYGYNFTSQTSITILGTSHSLGTADLLVFVYDSATGTRNLIMPNSISIDSTTYNVTVTFVAAQSGRVILQG